MKKTSKKLISLLLAVLMVLSSLTVGFVAFAADEEPEKTKVQLIEEEISAYYANHRSNLYLNDTDGKGDDAAEAEKKAAARKAFDELAAKVKALTEAEKLEMDLCTYVYWLTVVQEDVIRLASGNIYTSSSTAAKIELVTTKLGEIEAVTGNLPADYKAAVSAFMPYTVKVGSYSLTGSSFDYSQPEAQKALSDLIANLSKLSLAGLNFTDYLYVTTGGYYFSTSSISTTSKVGTTINNLIGYIEAKVKKTSGITVPSAPSAATFVQRKMIGIGNYDYVWRTYKVDGVDVEYTVKDVNDAFSEYAEKYAVDGVALDKAILDEALAAIKGMKALPGVADVIANYVAVAAEVKAAGGEIKDAKKVDDAVKAISAFEGDVLTIYDKIAANTKLSGMFLAGSPLDEKSSAEYVYNNAASLFERRALGGTRWYLFQAVEAIKVSALDEYVATVDMENITEDVVAKALELFLAIDGGERGKVSAETKTKLTTIFKPLGDGEDYADFVANFVKTPVDRDAIGGEVIWTAQGVQSAVDGLWSMVVNELGPALSMAGIDLSKGLLPLISGMVATPDLPKAIIGLYATLSKDQSDIGMGAITLGAAIQLLCMPKTVANGMPEEKFAGAVKKLTECVLTDEDKEAGMNLCEKATTIEFTNEDFGIVDIETAVDATLAVLRPILGLLVPGANIMNNYFGVEMCEYYDNEGVYHAGVYGELMPLLETLGLKSLPTTAEYKANYEAATQVAGNTAAMAAEAFVRPIIDAVLNDILYPICEDPLNGLVEVLPRLAYALDTDLINTSVKAALSNAGLLSGIADGLDLSKDAINAMIPPEVDLSGLLGMPIVLTIPALDWAKFANACTVEAVPSKTPGKDYFVLRTGDADSCFTEVFYLLHEVLFSNDDAMNALIEQLAPLDAAIVGMTGGKLSVERLQKWNKADKFGAYNDFLETFGEPTGADLHPVDPPTDGPNGGNGGKPVKPTNPNDKTPVKPTNPNIPNTGVEMATVATGTAYVVAMALVGLAVSMLLGKKKIEE